MKYKIGIDVGGTFTDFLVTDSQGATQVYKTPTTPHQPAVGVLQGLRKIAASLDRELSNFLGRVSVIVHGTTITTNAVLTGEGAKTAFLTTRGFRDVLNMRRGLRERQYDSKYGPPPPLVPRAHIYPISERVNVEGAVVTPLHEADVMDAIAHIRAHAIEAVAISYLWSFLNPAHERRTGQLIQDALPDVYVSLSSEVLPQIRAYERHSTTVLNATVGPPLSRYLTQLESQLDASGFAGVLLIMQSNGGVMSPRLTRRFAANTLLSGPAGGPMAGVFYADTYALCDVITVDMGGTSFDACLIHDRQPVTTTEGEIGGHRLALPLLDIHTVGAGGGSIAWIDAGGILQVGPKSAGAEPGPVCYGRGGVEPTVTDANLVLGYLSSGGLLGGEMPLDYHGAQRAVTNKIAEPLGLSPTEAAEGIYRIVNANMAAALQGVSIERGYDPREFALVVAGGAGPLHAGMIARELDIPLIVIPQESSVFCAAGMLISDLQHDYVQTFTRDWDAIVPDDINRTLGEIEEQARVTLSSEGIPAEKVQIHTTFDVRYIGQFHEVEVPVHPPLSESELAAVAARFHRLHEALYGYAMPEAPLEMINLRVKALGLTEKPRLTPSPFVAADPAVALKGKRCAYFSGTPYQVAVYNGDQFDCGMALSGPALIEQANTTVLVPPSYRLVCDAYRNYVMHPAERPLDEILAGLGGRTPEGARGKLPVKIGTVRKGHGMQMDRIDPILISVIANRLDSITKEMGQTMLRTSRSPIFSEARDFVTAIYDRQLRLVAQTAYIPILLAATPWAVRSIAETYTDDTHEGDVFILNDPYRGNNHPPDFTIAKPVHIDGELRFWSVTKGHQADTGGGGAAGYHPEARDVWDEGLRIPPAKLYERGKVNRGLWEMIVSNVRLRFLVEGDLHCLVGAAGLGERNIIALVKKHGISTVEQVVEHLLAASEKHMREEVHAIPNGTYLAERQIDNDGIVHGRPVTIRVKVEVQDESVMFDYSGSDNQVLGYVNSPFANTASATYLALFTLVNPDVPHNEGAMRPVSIVAPSGSVVNPVEPAPSTACTVLTGETITEAVWLALSEVIPERVQAAWGRWCAPATTGMNPRTGRPFGEIHFLSKGGGGATAGFDGWDHIGTAMCLGGLRSPDPELHELVNPYFIEQFEYCQDSAGAGQWRGGMGVAYRWRVEADNIACANFGSGTQPTTAPFGLRGGQGAPPNRQVFHYADGRTEESMANSTSILSRGDEVELFSSGGGGFGDPKQREIEKVVQDVRDGLVSMASARRDYGVVMDSTTFVVDEAATARLRNGR